MIWSPSHTTKWLTCPVKWQLMRRDEAERRDKGWTPAMVAGTAVHAGFAALMNGEPMGLAQQAADAALHKDWPEHSGDWDELAVRTKVEKALVKLEYEREELFQDAGRVVSVEEQLDGTEEDRKRGTYKGTPDLITEHGSLNESYLAVTDLKTHWALDDLYVQRDQDDTRHSWQMYQYAYFAQEKYKVPARAVRKVTVRLSPAPKVWVFTWEVGEEELQRWHEHATLVWQQMSEHDECGSLAWQNWTQCRGQYGKCGYYHICH